MNVELFPFQKKALTDLRAKTNEAIGSYHRTHTPQVVSFTAPTGAGKTIIMSALIESILFGDDSFPEQPNAIVVWLSDSPQLNEQSKIKIDAKADKIRLSQCVTITEDSFDKEFLEDGHIYFLNTQKLSVSSKLTKVGDGRTYTIWETLANTVSEKSDRLYFIIDEAHRGMQGKDASRATSIMQKFIKGSEADNIPPMPVVIGMSATSQRFDALVKGTSSTIHKSIIEAADVRASGLLKDRIIITYPEESATNRDMAILQAAADDWKEKWQHWNQYCREQHYGQVNPVFIVQVLNGTGTQLTETDLDDCLTKIEERTGFKFEAGQVVHTFGATSANLIVKGIEVRYEEPSRIADNKNIRVVFFKENLSTGWDCPRAETMMSFRHATDATYIAQLLGRMVRTPLQKHIQVDDVLNDVHLYLPYFNESTVKDVVNSLQSAEGGEIPTDVYGEDLGSKRFDTLTVKPVQITPTPTPTPTPEPQPSVSKPSQNPSPTQSKQMQFDLFGKNEDESSPSNDADTKQNEDAQTSANDNGTSVIQPSEQTQQEDTASQQNHTNPDPSTQKQKEPTKTEQDSTNKVTDTEQNNDVSDLFDREKVMKFINDAGLLSFNVRSVRINDYLKSLFNLAHLLSMSNLQKEAIKEVRSEVVGMIHKYITDLKARNEYEKLVLKIKQFKMSTQIFDSFGQSVDNYRKHGTYTTTETDIERQFRIAEAKLGRAGIGNAYGVEHMLMFDSLSFMIDVILFVENEDCMANLHKYAEARFHELNDKYRRYIAKIDSDKIRGYYDSIVSDGDVVSKHNFRLPETIQVPHESGGKAYRNHLFVNSKTGVATLKLNKWEEGVIVEEEKRDDFVCWIRNPVRASWALCIPYEIDGETKATYPDFIIVRKDDILEYVVDILEPHNPDFKDNLNKAKGFAEYAKQNPGLGRIQLIRLSKQTGLEDRFKRLDMYKTPIREKVLHAVSNKELDHIFDTDGFFD